MIRRPPRSTRTDTLFPYTTLFRSALIRLPHSELGMISPGEFIPLAEGTLLINPFTQWLLDQALSQLSIWLEKGFDLCLSINFSMKNFYDQALFELIYKTIKKYGLPPKKLAIELTETEFEPNISQVNRKSKHQN